MNKLICASLIAVFGLALSSCSKKEGVKDPVKAAEYEAKYTDLMKGWASRECIHSKVLFVTKSHFKIEYDFTGDAFTKRYNYYTDECGTLAARVEYKGNLVISDQGNGIKNLDLTYTKVTVTAVNDAGQKFLDGVDLCGQKVFPINQEVDMTDLSARTSCILQNSKEVVVYDSYSVNNGILQLGSGYSEKPTNYTPQDRPQVESKDFVAR